MTDVKELRLRLYEASVALSNVNLVYAAKWCAEALNGLAPISDPFDYPNPQLDDDEKHDQFSFMLAKTYFSCKEFDRAAYTLKDARSGNAVFLRLYAVYLSIDKKTSGEKSGFVNVSKESVGNGAENGVDVEGELDDKLGKVVSEAEQYHANGSKPNGFLHYLVGMIYAKKKKFKLAQASLLLSLLIFPYNWSCWQELLSTFTGFDEAMIFVDQLRTTRPQLANNFMFLFFEIVMLQEFYQRLPQFTEKLAALLEMFPTFTFLKVQKFLAAYHGLDYFQAESIFDEILMTDPMRLDDLDTYSNMLYVMEKKSKLSFLAQFASQIDKFRSETCCIIANYHSMKGEHDKSIMYYKRALTLNKNCLSAWTLMGHEFVELKNSHAAIESYRRAVDINAKDFRAWYGLGQTYEVLDMHLYALYYYQRATNLQPTDKRMWQAIGNCYEKIDKLEEALRSFEKAFAIDGLSRASEDQSDEYLSVEPHICYKLATISEKLGRSKETYRYMRICFEQEFDWGITDETSKARLWLARNALENRRYEEAYELAKEFSLNNAHDVGEARSIAKEARSRMAK
ncbi:CIC11C00000002327 [Sungouiella intermedia]|uniref:CIC11C00000002327 n=1 Tax=Sungouiella intermedia TaxID=45354 RepID=A0A1L0BPT5_9ASCO|nr:CIC11C00000002327 [[Candida] intermedia]